MKEAKKPIKRKVVTDIPEPSAKDIKIEVKEEKNPIDLLAERLDRDFRKALAEVTGPVDFPSFIRAFTDYFIHIAFSPGTALRLNNDYTTFIGNLTKSVVSPTPSSVLEDRRFKNEMWGVWPFSTIRDAYISYEDFTSKAANNIRGMDSHNVNLLHFALQQITETLNPLNIPATNPNVIQRTIEKGGLNLIEGFGKLVQNLIENNGKLDVRHSTHTAFTVGKNLAVTKGKVVFRNELIELIQYDPKTKDQYKTPMLIIPAIINKYYVMDLREENSMVKYLLDNNHQVFMISWKTADSTMRDFGFKEYLDKGTVRAIEAVRAITGQDKINAAGYCIGAILLLMTAAYIKLDDKKLLNSITLFAGQIDFSDAGVLKAFIDESQISFLQDLMEDKGYLDKEKMAQTFSFLRARDLFYEYALREYVLGEEPAPLDFLFWNDDGTKLPEKVHIELLKDLYLEDQLTEGKFRINQKSLDLREIDEDMYSVATISDHIAPWKNAYRIPHFVSSPMTFVLASSGHIAGVINPPGDNPKSYHFVDGTLGKGPDFWKESSRKYMGSWWPHWLKWLETKSGEKVPAYKLASSGEYKPIADAPGTFVFEK
jgi:polyhydroxyalkanoate synthase